MKQSFDAPIGRDAKTVVSHEPVALSGAFGELLPKIQKAIAAHGYVSPTPIQEQCIRPLLAGRDMLGAAQTGTGKTAAFTLPMLHRMTLDARRPRRGTPRALILAPTRELAAQIGESIATYGKFLPLTHTVIFGGVGQGRQVSELNRGVDILVATPGRLLDLIQQGFIHLNEVEFFVLDEVDRMLDMGFIPDVKRVLARLPKERQTLFFSATMPPKMVELANTMVSDPARVTIAPDKPAVERIGQRVMFVGKQHKDRLLVDVLDRPDMGKVIVFTQMKHVANKVVRKLEVMGITGAVIHGNKSQNARTRALEGFKRGEYRVLVATDVAARGIDVDDVTHVINYDLPNEAETYVHRIGRTARAGANGDAISFCSAEERAQLRDIERLLGRPVEADLDHTFHCQQAFDASVTGKGGGTPRGHFNKSSKTGERPQRPTQPNAGRRPFNRRGRRRGRKPAAA